MYEQLNTHKLLTVLISYLKCFMSCNYMKLYMCSVTRLACTYVAQTTNGLEHNLGNSNGKMCREHICSLFARNADITFLVVSEHWRAQCLLRYSEGRSRCGLDTPQMYYNSVQVHTYMNTCFSFHLSFMHPADLEEVESLNGNATMHEIKIASSHNM